MTNDETNYPETKIETGEQGPITEIVLELAKKIPGEDVQLINNIAAYIHSLKDNQAREVNFTRTADEIITSGEQWGCHEAGLIFVTLLRAKGEQATYIQAFLREDLENFDKDHPGNTRGHVFIKQNTPAGNRIINSTSGEVTETLPDKYVLGAEGLDSWDIGLKNGFDDYLPLFEKTKRDNRL